MSTATLNISAKNLNTQVSISRDYGGSNLTTTLLMEDTFSYGPHY